MSDNNTTTRENIENAIELYKAAQIDIGQIYATINNSILNEKEVVGRICRFAAEAVEKMLKGWLIYEVPNIEDIGKHNLPKLLEKAEETNTLFNKIETNVDYLNNFTPSLRYSSPHNIDEHEVKRCLKGMKEIYDFEPIKEVRNKLEKQNSFIELPKNINKLFGQYAAHETYNNKEELKASVIMWNLNNYKYQLEYEKADLKNREKDKGDKNTKTDKEILEKTIKLLDEANKTKEDADLIEIHRAFKINPKTNTTFNLYKYKKTREAVFSNTETLVNKLMETKYRYLLKNQTKTTKKKKKPEQ